MPASPPSTDDAVDITALRRLLCRVDGHRWHHINWIGLGSTSVCTRCGLRIGLKQIAADGRPIFYDTLHTLR